MKKTRPRKRINIVPEAVMQDECARWLWHYAKGVNTTFSVSSIAEKAGVSEERMAIAFAWFDREHWIEQVSGQPGIYFGRI